MKPLKHLAVLALSFLFCFSAFADKLKVGFVYVGPVGDHGWTYMHEQGRLAVKKAFGDKADDVTRKKLDKEINNFFVSDKFLTPNIKETIASILKKPKDLSMSEVNSSKDLSLKNFRKSMQLICSNNLCI